jgi:AAA domain-containing protein
LIALSSSSGAAGFSGTKSVPPAPAEAHPAQLLWAAGYGLAIIPIIPPGAPLSRVTRVTEEARGKLPGQKLYDGTWAGLPKWTTRQTTLAEIDKWISWGASFGMRTRDFPFVDIDVSENEVASAIAQSVDRAFGGGLLRRVGRAPRLAMPFRTDAPFKKHIFRLKDATGGGRGAVEVSGDGNQMVIEGIHSKTGKPYRWFDGDSEGGAEILAARSPESLPYLDESLVQDTLRVAIADAVAAFGLSLEEWSSGNNVNAHGVDQMALRAPSIAALAEVVAAIPNDESFVERPQYIGMLHAIRAAAGTDCFEEGLDIAQDWASRYTEGYNDPADVRRDYETCSPSRIGWDYLTSKARQHGHNSAQWYFDVDPNAVAPAAANSVDPNVLIASTDPGWLETASLGAKIAALHGYIDNALFVALSSVDPGHDVMQEITALRHAATRGHPLAEFFRRDVLDVATRRARYLDNVSLFTTLLTQDVRALKPRLCNNDVDLLVVAARVALTPAHRLAGALTTSPGPALTAAIGDRSWLLERKIPLPGVAGVIGEPGGGKTHSVLRLGFSVASDQTNDFGLAVYDEFAGARLTATGSVAYCASEDVAGVQERLGNWERAHGPVPNFRIFGRVPPLSSTADSIAFAWEIAETFEREKLPPLVMLVIDVFRSAFTGEENSSDDVGPAMANAQLIARMLGISVILVHHTPRGKTNARGSNAFEASVEFMALVEKDKDGFVWKEVRNKSAPTGYSQQFRLEDGVLVPSAKAASAVAPKPRTKVEECAIAVVEVVRELGRAGRRELGQILAIRFPALFGAQSGLTNPRSRVTDAIAFAKRAGELVEIAGGKYALPAASSRDRPTETTAGPGSLEDVL